MTPAQVLAVDLGGSSLKACLFDAEGVAIAAANVPLAFNEARERWSEQDPDVWWRALGRAADDIAAAAGPRFTAAAIAICGFTRTQVFLDAAGRSVRPALGFRDSRAAAVLDALFERPEIARHALAHELNPFAPVARLVWLKANEPGAWRRTHLVLEPKDFLAFRLTGEARTDAISQARLIEASSGEPSLAALAGLDRVPMPSLAQPTDVVGRVREGLVGALGRLAGAAVMCGCHDTFAAVAGLGALQHGKAYCISGSSEVFGLISRKPGQAEGLIAIRWGELWQIGGPGLNGANALDFILDRLEPSARAQPAKLEAVLAGAPHPQPLLFLPFLHGERVPYWNPSYRAAFLGLSSGHGRGDMVRAVMEGVAFVNRVVLQRAERASGTRAGEIRVGGGGARSPAWNQIRADILGRRVLASADAETGLLGGLALARVGLGIDRDLAAASERLSRGLTAFEPDPKRAARYDAMFDVFEDAVDQLADLSYRLGTIGPDR